jgi:signal transduction histidine kinase
MPTPLRLIRPWIEPAAGVLFITLWLVAETGRGGYHGGSFFVTVAVFGSAIAVSRLLPVAALSLVTGVLVLHAAQLLHGLEATSWPMSFATLGVVFVIAMEAPRRVALVALALSVPLAAAFGVVVGLGLNSWDGPGGAQNQLSMFTTAALAAFGVYLGAWAAGYVVRLNTRELRALLLLRTTAAQLDDVEVELTVTRERDRIARDVHDVLAHSLAVVVAQADGARFASASRPEVSDAALRSIADAARSALVDVRTLVEGLRDEAGDQPQPGLADIPPLLEQMSGAGMRTDAQHFGEPQQMTPAQQLAVYRIVQESLTNALRHAGRHAVTRLSFDWRGPGLALTVTSTGDEQQALPGSTGGHGIRGMRDRARLAGGWLTTGEVDDPPGFVVTAFIPTAPDRTAPSPALELAQ